ncbi:type VI secretion system tube protein Hcp [Loktanella salsilacus]|jgi:type VI secretion system secreted protein Hcp|uniref:Hcp family type VI secretion system effector n=1 Tax=Loktanella salsilacus TaxID=195913 RepID=UPI0020B7184B|nr:type VI secretion system tube protein Hcp [Loktanella salsilacus]UTH47143.1 type VI secretion system tube protein Hcp [Loktanella salsilacus]
MAVDMFLDIEGEIQGESQDKEHKDTIDVLAWSWGMSQSGSFHVGGGGGAGKANFQDLSITKWIDNSSAELMKYCANGDHFPSATLYIRKAGKVPLEYLVIKMGKMMITSVSTGGSGGEDRLTENITLNFAEVKVEYKKQKEDGSGEAAKEFPWNIAKNSADVDLK